MSALHKPSARLARLDRILSQSPPHVAAHATTETDPGQVHLTSVPLDRIQALTMELQDRSTEDTDEVDAITMRLLLNDYKAAVAHLRAVANGADSRLHAVGAELHESRKTVRREEEMVAKRAGQSEEDAKT
jgi:hypothetical protein